MKKKISRKMMIGQMAQKYPVVAQLLLEKYGWHCVGCPMSAMESLEDGARGHGLSDKEIGKMMKYLNEKVAKDEKV